jgi:hypothetical protein
MRCLLPRSQLLSTSNELNRSLQPTAGWATTNSSEHVYEVRARKDRRGFDLISDGLPFGRLWYRRARRQSAMRIGYATFFSRSHDAVIRVYDEASNVIETRQHAGSLNGIL